MDGFLGVVFDQEWSGVEARWIDATGRVVVLERMGNSAGEVFIALPDMPGWARWRCALRTVRSFVGWEFCDLKNALLERW